MYENEVSEAEARRRKPTSILGRHYLLTMIRAFQDEKGIPAKDRTSLDNTSLVSMSFNGCAITIEHREVVLGAVISTDIYTTKENKIVSHETKNTNKKGK